MIIIEYDIHDIQYHRRCNHRRDVQYRFVEETFLRICRKIDFKYEFQA